MLKKTLCHGRNPAGNKWPLTTMILNNYDAYPELITYGISLGVTPWWFDIEYMLTSMKIRESVPTCQ